MIEFLARPRGTILAACAVALAIASPAAAQYTLPPDFVDEQVIGNLNQPAGMAVLPDGRILFVEQRTAKVRLVVNGAIAATDPVVTVPSVNSVGGEQGLLGIAVDPGWPARPYIYVQYDHAGDSKIWISRYTVGGDLSFTGNGALTINTSTRYDILTILPDNADYHNGGTLRFGPDGMLYSSLGDDGTGCPAQDLTVLVGKILRLNVSGLPAGGGGPPALSAITPANNPFVGNANANARLVWFSGLRNPFRFNIDKVTGNLAIADVGENQWEEIDYTATPGKSFEWPVKEGFQPGLVGSCPGADVSAYVDPIYSYNHTDGQAVMGGLVYRRPSSGANRFPPDYDGDIFLNDYYSTWLRRLKGSGSSWTLVGGGDWAGGSSNNVSDMAVAPDGALLYCRQFAGGSTGAIRRIRYAGTSSVPPVTAALEFHAPYPLPARASVSLDYSLPAPSSVTISIFDLTGRQVRTLVRSESQGSGPHHLVWDTKADDGHTVEAGVYFAQITLGGVSRQRRLVVVR